MPGDPNHRTDPHAVNDRRGYVGHGLPPELPVFFPLLLSYTYGCGRVQKQPYSPTEEPTNSTMQRICVHEPSPQGTCDEG
jgi:hypothetical protein